MFSFVSDELRRRPHPLRFHRLFVLRFLVPLLVVPSFTTVVFETEGAVVQQLPPNVNASPRPPGTLCRAVVSHTYLCSNSIYPLPNRKSTNPPRAQSSLGTRLGYLSLLVVVALQARFAGQKISPSSPTRGCPLIHLIGPAHRPRRRGSLPHRPHRRLGGARSSIYSARRDENVIIRRTLYGPFLIGEFRGDRTEVGVYFITKKNK